jgi:hypothetical protein
VCPKDIYNVKVINPPIQGDWVTIRRSTLDEKQYIRRGRVPLAVFHSVPDPMERSGS